MDLGCEESRDGFLEEDKAAFPLLLDGVGYLKCARGRGTGVSVEILLLSLLSLERSTPLFAYSVLLLVV